MHQGSFKEGPPHYDILTKAAMPLESVPSPTIIQGFRTPYNGEDFKAVQGLNRFRTEADGSVAPWPHGPLAPWPPDAWFVRGPSVPDSARKRNELSNKCEKLSSLTVPGEEER